jgi:hypothetical protein
MSVTLSLFAGAGAQFFDNNGNVLSGGKIYTYQAGTTTPLATYTTNSESAFHTNPIILDAAGRVPSGGEIWLQLGIGYKFVLRTSTEVLIATYDNIPSSAQPPAANDADSIMYEQGYTVTAGSFVVGKIYRIVSVGTTDFTLIGAVNNTVGTHFIATGAGTGTGTAELSQTVEAKLRQIVSVMDFGADPTGVIDSSPAFQAAIDAASCVTIPVGNYRLDSTINLGASTQLLGDNAQTCILTYTGTGTAIRTVVRGFWLRLSNFQLFCSNASNNGVGILFGIYEQDSIIDTVFIRYFGNGGIEIQGGLHVTVRKCKINNCNQNLTAQSVGILIRETQNSSPGIAAGTPATTIVLEDNYINEYGNTPGNAIGIAWVKVYQGHDIRNITENGNIGRSVAGGTPDSYVEVINPYFEALTSSEIIWTDSLGYYNQGNGSVNPNTVATWAITPPDFRFIPYIATLARADYTDPNLFGSSDFIGPVHFDRRSVLSYTNFADQNIPYVSTATEINAFEPLAARTYTLPTAVGIQGYIARVLKTNSANSQTIVPFGSETISGAASYALTQQGEHVTIISDGVNWQVIEAGGFKQAAIPDTSGATLGQLETTVNAMKAALRNFGIIAI